MNYITAFQKKLQGFGIEFLAESDCDRILTEYARINHSQVLSPYKPRTYLTEERGNAGRTNVHIQGTGKVCFGDTSFEAKLNLVCSLLEYKYFALDPQLQIIKPVIF